MNDSNCKLCIHEPSSSIGSHIFPAYIIKTAFDEEGRNRDHEIMYSISSIEFQDKFFGRSVLPDKVTEELGRELSEEEMKKRNFFVRSNLLCKKCEAKLKVVEDYFCLNIHEKFKENDVNHYAGKELDGDYNNLLIRLFIYSLFWRASVTKINGFELKPEFEEKLRLLLIDIIEEKTETTLLKAEERNERIKDLPLSIFRGPIVDKSSSNLVYLPLDHVQPYITMVNDYIFFLFEKKSEIIQDFYHVNYYDFLNYKESDVFKIASLSIKDWEKLKGVIIQLGVDKMLKNIVELYREMYKRKFTFYPSEPKVKRFLNFLVIDNDNKIGDLYSKENIVKAMNESLR